MRSRTLRSSRLCFAPAPPLLPTPFDRVGYFAACAQGTPVNEETLAKWKADRKAKKLAEERRKVCNVQLYLA